MVKSAAEVALEAGNSPQMIFQHHRELVRPAEAKAWFDITPEKQKSGKQKETGGEGDGRSKMAEVRGRTEGRRRRRGMRWRLAAAVA